MPTMSSAELVKSARRRYGLSQRRLAVRAGTSQAFISRIEQGDVSPTIRTLRRILLVMGEDLVIASRRLQSDGDHDGPAADEHRGLSMDERLERGLAFSAFAAELHGQALGS
jgi:transcriptional regulator with XRE-family HTH domain